MQTTDSLTRYIDDGNIQIDNNAAERHIKPF
ncbi:IS66 family transposase, partial [Bathymodiolus platifrons methanotrophic gill symbiont]